MARPDGSANLILEGVARVRISDYVKLRPYRVARVEPLKSSDITGGTKGEPLLKMSEHLREYFTGAETWRANLIARTEAPAATTME